MSGTRVQHAGAVPGRARGPEPRVRELARDALARMAFSLAVSVATPLLLLLLAHGLGR